MRMVVTSKNIDTVKAKTGRRAVKTDDYLAKLVKYIPSEVIALYLTLYGIVLSAKDQIPFELITWLIFVIGIIATPLWLLRVTNVYDRTNLLISTGAFVVWVFTLGGPFANLSWYHPVYGTLLLPVYTFFIPIVTK